MRSLTFAPAAALLFIMAGCSHEPEPKDNQPIFTMDPHSHARPQEARITHLSLDLEVDMEAEQVSGTARYDIAMAKDAERIVFDTDGLDIERVTLDDGEETAYSLGDTSFLGRALTVTLAPGTRSVTIAYRTGPGARALQWLKPQQTSGKRHPFLFTQGQAILTRTWIPIQDSPGIRFTYEASMRVPKGLMAVMSAENPTEVNADGAYAFRMEQPIPAYLIALAVGDLAFVPVGERTGVYAEPDLVQKAAWEFADMERMLTTAEALYGDYRWGRYDVIVLPPSFPFGGMENPRLTFATPTILAGDRSLTALVAHELAHSWSGNLVTNATWNDFWLNEGFTVYFENRICEAVYGDEYARMLQLLGRQDLHATIAKLEGKGQHADTHLRLHLEGRDPDEGMNDVAYEKGFALLKLLEEKAGRAKFDAFLRGYFDAHAFRSMTTDDFVAYLDDHLLKPEGIELNVAEWIDGAGLPDNAIEPQSDSFAKVEAEIARWASGTAAEQIDVQGWTTFHWMHFLRHLPEGLDSEKMKELDEAFAFTANGNAEVLSAWLELCIRNDFDPAFDRLDQFLTTVGRRKFLLPLYAELNKSEKGRLMAHTIYTAARGNYHSVSVRSLDELLAWKENRPAAKF
ncbi:MAG: M1 family metallopeptidase [Flavobacteriales bacterium]|jgi:aminopeptidase N|nr:M1 family metallopeptidase [Flavobacteriales bacterium]